MRFSNPIDLHAVAQKYPDVPIVIPHFGAGYFREALMVATLCPNVYLDTSSSNDWTRLQVPPISVRGAFRQALKVLGPQRLLFGTDSSFFPRGWQSAIFEAQAAALHELGTSSTDAQLIFADNLLRILAR
jgi:predicted TIM-barrel fold metal-dependent hydrolase